MYFCTTFNQEEQKMKKIYFAIAACAMFAFAACNSSTDAGKTDSTMADSIKVAEPVAAPADTTPKADTTVKVEIKKEEKK